MLLMILLIEYVIFFRTISFKKIMRLITQIIGDFSFFLRKFWKKIFLKNFENLIFYFFLQTKKYEDFSFFNFYESKTNNNKFRLININFFSFFYFYFNFSLSINYWKFLFFFIFLGIPKAKAMHLY